MHEHVLFKLSSSESFFTYILCPPVVKKVRNFCIWELFPWSIGNVLTLYGNSKCFDCVFNVNYVIIMFKILPSNLEALLAANLIAVPLANEEDKHQKETACDNLVRR